MPASLPEVLAGSNLQEILLIPQMEVVRTEVTTIHVAKDRSEVAMDGRAEGIGEGAAEGAAGAGAAADTPPHLTIHQALRQATGQMEMNPLA